MLMRETKLVFLARHEKFSPHTGEGYCRVVNKGSVEVSSMVL